MNVLVTGGAGYIGSSVVKLLLDSSASVVVYDDLSEGDQRKVDPRATFVQGDVLDREALAKVCASNQFDAVIHCAAKKVMFEGEENPTKYFTNNIGGTINVLSCMEEHSIPKIVFSSTAAVYAQTADGRPAREDDLVDPQSVYGRSKLMCEMLIQEYARLGKIKEFAILRYFNVAGDVGLLFKEKNPHGVFPSLARAMTQKTPFSIFGTDYQTRDGSAVRDYIHLEDLTRAHIQALEAAGVHGVYNLGTSNGCTVRELIETFKEVAGVDIEVIEAPRRAGDIGIMLADASKARRELQWEPHHTLREIISNTVEVYTQDPI